MNSNIWEPPEIPQIFSLYCNNWASGSR